MTPLSGTPPLLLFIYLFFFLPALETWLAPTPQWSRTCLIACCSSFLPLFSLHFDFLSYRFVPNRKTSVKRLLGKRERKKGKQFHSVIHLNGSNEPVNAFKNQWVTVCERLKSWHQEMLSGKLMTPFCWAFGCMRRLTGARPPFSIQRRGHEAAGGRITTKRRENINVHIHRRRGYKQQRYSHAGGSWIDT